jgi:hypothetical protein
VAWALEVIIRRPDPARGTARCSGRRWEPLEVGTDIGARVHGDGQISPGIDDGVVEDGGRLVENMVGVC